MDARADVEPGGRDDHGVDEWSLDAVEDGRLVAFVDDAHRDQHHPGPEVDRGLDEKIQIRLFQLELAALFEALDDGVLQLELANETDPIRETVRDQQHEAVEIEHGRGVARLVEMQIHVAGEARLLCAWRFRRAGLALRRSR